MKKFFITKTDSFGNRMVRCPSCESVKTGFSRDSNSGIKSPYFAWCCWDCWQIFMPIPFETEEEKDNYSKYLEHEKRYFEKNPNIFVPHYSLIRD